MATYTERYNLKKPAGEDFYNIGDFNENMDKIATALADKADKVVTGEWTIPSTAWGVMESPIGEYKYAHLERLGVTEKSVVDCVVDLASEEAAQDCGVAQYCKTIDGGVEVYAKEKPTTNIIVHYSIIEGV